MAQRVLSEARIPRRELDFLTVAGRFPWLYSLSALTLLFLYVPIAMVVLFSFSVDVTTGFPIRGPTLSWYLKVLNTPALLSGARNSMYVAVGTAWLAALVATPAALALTRYRFRWRGALSAAFAVPLALPTLILGVSLLLLFSLMRVRLSLLTVIVGHTLYLTPLMFLVVRARLMDMDRFIEEAARHLGASGWRTFWEVTFPLIRSSIVGWMFLIFAQSFDLFVITFLTIGAQSTLPLVVWSMLRTGVNISTLLFGTSAMMLIIASRFAKITVEV